MLTEKQEKTLVYLRGLELPVTIHISDIANAAGYKMQTSPQGTTESSGAAGMMVRLRKMKLIDYEAKKGYTIKWVSPDGVETLGDIVFEPSANEIPDNEVKPYIEKASIAIRERRVMIDRDLAKLYGVETRRLNEQRERNPDKFPVDFAFQLSDVEISEFESQNATHIMAGRRGESPWVYTLEGCNMAATVLSTPAAVKRSVIIIRTFSDLERMAHGEEPKQPGFADMMQAIASGFGVVRQNINEINIRIDDSVTPALEALEKENEKLHAENDKLNRKVLHLDANAEKYRDEATRRRLTRKMGDLGRIEMKLMGITRFHRYWATHRDRYAYKVAETPYDECVPIFHDMIHRIKSRLDTNPDAIMRLSDEDKNFLITSGAWGNFDGTEIPVRVNMVA